MQRILDKIPTRVWVSGGDEELNMQFSDGTSCKWYHEQDCCESVGINDITGDLQGLVGLPLLVAEKRTSEGDPAPDLGYEPESCTWTFYTFRNVNVSVDVRWFAILCPVSTTICCALPPRIWPTMSASTSNGYYSESVDFRYVGPN